jgi:hypothetical protein
MMTRMNPNNSKINDDFDDWCSSKVNVVTVGAKVQLGGPSTAVGTVVPVVGIVVTVE